MMEQKISKPKQLKDIKEKIRLALLENDSSKNAEPFFVQDKLDSLAKHGVLVTRPARLIKIQSSPTKSELLGNESVPPEVKGIENLPKVKLPTAENPQEPITLEDSNRSVSPIELLDDDSDSSSCSYHAENISAECTIRFKFENNIFRIAAKKADLFWVILENVSKEINIPKSNIVLYRKTGVMITDTDSPENLKLGVAEILDCFLLSPSPSTQNQSRDEVEINLTFQTEDRRSTVSLSVKPNETFGKIKCKYLETKNLENSSSDVVFIFDGENVNEDCTPKDLDMEDEDCIDVRLKR